MYSVYRYSRWHSDGIWTDILLTQGHDGCENIKDTEDVTRSCKPKENNADNN
jgi:hypothetical protein